MATETLSYSQLGDRLSWPEAARTLVRRLRLPRQKVNERSDASLKARIEELEAQLAQAEASAASHRTDFERERERCERLTLELIRAAVETMNAKEAAARLEGELAARRSRPWWKWLAGVEGGQPPVSAQRQEAVQRLAEGATQADLARTYGYTRKNSGRRYGRWPFSTMQFE